MELKDFLMNIKDRYDLEYSPYVGAIDIQYAHYAPYLWSFTLDNVGTVTGRTFDDLRDFLELLRKRMQLSPDHKLVIIVDDLSTFFGNTKKELPYAAEPIIAKSESEVLMAEIYGCYQLHCYKAYFETDVTQDMIRNGIYIPDINADELSARCKLSEDEINNCINRSYFIAQSFRTELDLKYGSGQKGGSPANLPLTLTARVTRLISAEMRRQSNKAQCNIQKQIMKKNPITSEWGRECLLPLLYKAFFGGVSFFEDGVLDQPFDNVNYADMTSAYIARMVLSEYPIGEFFELPIPEDFNDLMDPPYSDFAMLITFEASDVTLREGGLPFLPSQLRHGWADMESSDEQLDLIERTSSTRIKTAKMLRMTLTDIDFRLFLENYKPSSEESRIRIINIMGSRYGYLPDYIQKVIVKLYSSKMKAKYKLKALEKLGIVPQEIIDEYERIKSEPARLYGIFTKSPVMKRYSFDAASKELKVIDKSYISPEQKWTPVLYQWGVWTTALVRKEIAYLRRKLMSADRQIRIISGDTDCINYQGAANDIIAEYNEEVKEQIRQRSEDMGIEPELLKDLGALSVTTYKKYKVTGLKQYCYIRETDAGDVFGYKVGGMSTVCEYFNKEFKTPEQRFNHFGLGLTIPAEYQPRRIRSCIVKDYVESWTDRDGNNVEERIQSHIETIYKRFTIFPIMAASPLGNKIRPSEAATAPTLDEIKDLARRVSCPVFDPANYARNKEE